MMDFVEILDLVQEYTNLQQQLHAQLQNGFFGFTRHRKHTSTPFSQSFLGVACDPTIGVLVNTSESSTIFEIDDGSGNSNAVDTASDSVGLRNRKEPTSSSSSSESTNSSNKNDPLLLFAPLPSQHLRSSQDAFRNAIDLIVRIANVKSQIAKKVSDS